MKNLDLGKEKINKLLLTFAIPCVISMLINSVYNIVDQIFIGKGVGTLGNAATNVIFPLVILFNAVAGLIGNGSSANLSLKLGEKKFEEARKSVGGAITLSFIVSIVFGILAFFLLPQLIYFFGSTENVYNYALDYGRIIILGAPFMIVYTAMASIIRSDGAPQYSMFVLVSGAIINLVLDPLFIFTFGMGVKGGALATVIGQIVSFILSILYIPKIKSIKLTKNDFYLNKSILRTLALGLSSFITQITILVLFVFMNNMMTKYGALSVYGADIPLSVYGVISKINGLYVSAILGISIGAQPIVGFNYGAGNYDRVKETLKKVLFVNLVIGILFNLLLFCFPKYIIGIFISADDESYPLFIEFAILTCRTFLCVCALNALEMTTSIIVQSLGKVVKATSVSFIRQIILFIPFALMLCNGVNKGIYGILYAGPIADVCCFLICLFLFGSEYYHVSKKSVNKESIVDDKKYKETYKGPKVVVTVAREYGSGGRYVGSLLAQRLGVAFYDKELIHLSSKESGLSENYVEEYSQKKRGANYANNNDDLLFIAEEKVIKKLAQKESCVIVGRCADAILKENKNVFRVFLYSDTDSEVKRAIKYYGLKKDKALKEVRKVNKARAKHYQFYTNQEWGKCENYDIMLHVDALGIDETVDVLYNIIINKK